jgi:hypothetical protein
MAAFEKILVAAQGWTPNNGFGFGALEDEDEDATLSRVKARPTQSLERSKINLIYSTVSGSRFSEGAEICPLRGLETLHYIGVAGYPDTIGLLEWSCTN